MVRWHLTLVAIAVLFLLVLHSPVGCVDSYKNPYENHRILPAPHKKGITAVATNKVETKGRSFLADGLEFGFGGSKFSIGGGFHGIGGGYHGIGGGFHGIGGGFGPGFGWRPFLGGPHYGGYYFGAGVPGFGLGLQFQGLHHFKHHYNHGWGWGVPPIPFHG